MMFKKLLVTGLVMALAAVAVVPEAQAKSWKRSRYCCNNGWYGQSYTYQQPVYNQPVVTNAPVGNYYGNACCNVQPACAVGFQGQYQGAPGTFQNNQIPNNQYQSGFRGDIYPQQDPQFQNNTNPNVQNNTNLNLQNNTLNQNLNQNQILSQPNTTNPAQPQNSTPGQNQQNQNRSQPSAPPPTEPAAETQP